MLKRVLAFLTVCSLVGVLAIMQSSIPSESNPLVMLLVFFLLYLSALGVLTFLLNGAYWILFRTVWQKRGGDMVAFTRLFMYGSVLALAPVILLAMLSVGKVEAYEVMLVIVLELVALFYVRRQR